MYYSTIKWTDVANGTGMRLSLFVSGCPHACPGCFNQETWDFRHGAPYTPEIQESILDKLGASYLRGLSLLGGEPFAPPNQEPLLDLLQAFHHRYPEKDVWCYSGYLWEDLVSGKVGQFSSQLLEKIDILVDGSYLQEKKNLSLFFRGSENQRIIDVQSSLSQKSPLIISDENIGSFTKKR